MPICRFRDQYQQPKFALYQDDRICPLEPLIENTGIEFNLFDFDPNSLDTIPEDQWQPLPDQLLPPIENPEKVFCIGLNYRDHAIETGASIPTEPIIFSKFASALVGHGAPIELPAIAKRVDYEAELVVVIGKTAKNISVAEAMDVVYGYTCGHDVSARDWQKGRPGGQWLLGKTFDTFAPIGPCIVTKSELADPSNLRVRMNLNSETVQDSTTAQLIFDIPTTIAHLSQFVTLRPGDLIFTGTPPGVGDAKDPPVYLKPGDRCDVVIDGIGRLSNPVH